MAGKLDEDNVEDADETHFMVNMDYGKALGFKGSDDFKWAYVISGDEGMTIVLILSGGRNSTIDPAFLIFKNQQRSYPIRGVPDIIPALAYSKGPKGCMDSIFKLQWMNERRFISKLENCMKRVLYLDNCEGLKETKAVKASAKAIITEIIFFPRKDTHILQPCASFIIQKIRTE